MRIALLVCFAALMSAVMAHDITPPAGFKSETLRRGNCAKKIAAGDVATVSFTGRIAQSSATGERGAIFDSSKPNEPLRAIAGSDDSVPGLSFGLIGACVGERRRLTIPPEWAFGSEGFMRVPGGATVEMTIEVLEASTPPNLFAEIDTNRDNRVTRQELVAWLLGKGVPRSEVNNVAGELIKQDDKNRDGVIEWSEYSGPRGAAPAGRSTRTLRSTDDEVDDTDPAADSGAAADPPMDHDDDSRGEERDEHTRFRDIDRERARLLASDASLSEVNERLLDMGAAPLPDWDPAFDRFLDQE